MAITNAQQYQQLVNKPADGKRPGYRGDAAARSTGAAQSGRADPGSRGDPGEGRASRDSGVSRDTGGYAPSAFTGGDSASTGRYDEVSPQALQRAQQFIESQTKPQSNFLDQIINYINPLTKREQFYNLATNFLPGSKQSITNARQAYAKYLEEQGITPSEELLDTENLYDYFDTQAFEKNLKPVDAGMAAPMNYGDFIAEKFGLPGVKYSGDVGGLEMYVAERDPITGKATKYGYNERAGGEGQSGQTIPPLIPPEEDEVDPDSLPGIIKNRIAYRFMADGGRAGFMGGGMPYEGGIMDLESARQMYGLGKLVKKATGAIKKIVKSPVGKAALLYFGGNALMNQSGSLGIKDFLTRSFLGKEVSGGDLSGRGRTGGIFQFMKDNPLLTIAGGSTLAGLLSSQDEEEEPYDRGPGLDIDAIRRDPYGTKGPAFGFYAEGGNVKEPVAKDTMPLLDMNGMEKDYRADGGFVPIGRMERADDVPARLSKNEFVFTADAVRNAGDGDIDKGAEVMYNMMKNLEAGGDISEESQGLNGARDMFQTSKRLEEVL
jgi:hypothetical protein